MIPDHSAPPRYPIPATFGPDTVFPFETYRPIRSDNKGFLRESPETAPSIAHFVFSERFRGIDEEARKMVLDLPSTTEARKVQLALEHPATEWTANHERMIKMALWKQFSALPSLAEKLANGSVGIGSSIPLGKGWEARHGGQERWEKIVLAVAGRFVGCSDRMSLLATGDTDVFNPFVFSSKIGALLSTRVPDQMVIACRRGVDAMAELWAISNYVPAVHHLLRKTPSGPIRDDSIRSLAELATHSVLFMKPNSMFCKALGTQLIQRAVPVRLVALDDHGRPLPKKPTSTPARAAPARR